VPPNRKIYFFVVLMKRLFPLALTLIVLAPTLSAAPKTPPKKPTNQTKPRPKTTAKPAARPQVNPAQPQPIPSVAAPVVKGPKTWALLVGIGKYQSDQIGSLRFPAKDAAGMRDALLDPNLGGLAPNQVLLITDEAATRDKITGAVNSFLRPNVKEGDKVVVFLAGHGIAKGIGLNAKSYLLPTDVQGLTLPALERTAVPLRALADDLGTLPASQFVIFMDACREDPTPGRGAKPNGLSNVMSRSITVVPKEERAQSATFFACSVGQRAFEDKELGHGVFTSGILQGLRQGAIAQKPDGAVDMGRLSSYVSEAVNTWAKKMSSSGDYEYDQTPELIAQPLTEQMVLLKLRRSYADTPISTSPPRLFVAASPEGALVTINGARAGTGATAKDLPSEGDYTVTVTNPGYAPISRSVKALGGYEQQLDVQLQPTTAGAMAQPTADDPASSFYKRALDAEEHQQWEIAEQGYSAAITANPRFGAAYQALYDLHRLRNRNLDVIGDALGLVANSPHSAQTLSLLSRSYSYFASHGAGEGNAATTLRAVDSYGTPKNPGDAVKLAQRAANEALKLDSNSPAANVAQGYALAALDNKAKNKREALAAWGKAAFLDPQDPANYLGLGYGIRFYASLLKDTDASKTPELRRAVATLQQATKIRPNYYEAHRELAFCYIQLGDTEAALRECNLAKANFDGASDNNEAASVYIAMAGLHQKEAQNSTGQEKEDNEAASKGYAEDAKTTATDIKVAMSILGAAGVSTSLRSYLPSEVQRILNITPNDIVNDALGNVGGGALGGVLGGIFGR
jgi:hypothetical protein